MKLRKFVIPPIVVVLVFVAMYRVSRPGREIEYFKFGALFSVIYVAMNWLSIKAGEWNLKSSYARKGTNRSVLCEHVLEITPDGLVEKTPFNETRTAWNAIEAVEQTKDFLFIYIQSNAAHIVPIKAVAEGDVFEFRKQLAAHVAAESPASPPRQE